MGEVLAQKFVDALDAARHTADLRRLISALGIRHVGEADGAHPGRAFLRSGRAGKRFGRNLAALPDVGPEVASSIRNFFDSPANRETLARLKTLGLWPQSGEGDAAAAARPSGPLADKRVLFTGSLDMPATRRKNWPRPREPLPSTA